VGSSPGRVKPKTIKLVFVISKINVKKATGIDGIIPKLLHYAKPVVTKPISNLVIFSIV
jgi:hypothetical protein